MAPTKDMFSPINVLVDELNTTVSKFISFFENDFNFSVMIYDKWSAKDVLGHIVFWHESFAKNVTDLALHIKPSPLRGKLSKVNELSVDSTRNVTISELLNRLSHAQSLIETHITSNSISLIPYKIGSRPYSAQEHLMVVNRHIQKHLFHLTKKYQNA